ncbi:MAG TPA: FkbM family methyltransferase [Beijerinckiaceae bacterium]|nr:FkbM family methyltransferase [Beijerinckiaceae bacterium]
MNDTAPFGAYAPSGLARWIIERTQNLPNTWAGRRANLLLRRIAIPLLGGKPLDVERLGVRMRLYPYANICDKKVLFTPQFFDPEEFEVLRGRMHDGFVFIDVGANIGAYALFVAAQAGPAARVLAVEPQPQVFERLTYNIRQNPFGTIKAVACAVADRPGELTLFLDPRNSGESSVKVVGSGQSEPIRVPATTLLNLIRQEGYARVDAVKLDVEGAEDLILAPFFRDAPQDLWPSLLIVEDGRGQWELDLPKLVGEQGYRLVARTRLNLVYERP